MLSPWSMKVMIWSNAIIRLRSLHQIIKLVLCVFQISMAQPSLEVLLFISCAWHAYSYLPTVLPIPRIAASPWYGPGTLPARLWVTLAVQTILNRDGWHFLCPVTDVHQVTAYLVSNNWLGYILLGNWLSAYGSHFLGSRISRIARNYPDLLPKVKLFSIVEF